MAGIVRRCSNHEPKYFDNLLILHGINKGHGWRLSFMIR